MNTKAQERNGPDLVGSIRAIKAEIARLQSLLDEATAELVSENGTKKNTAVPVVAPRHPAPPRKATPPRGGGHHPALELVAGSASSLAADAIRAAGRPLHARDLIKAMEERGQKVKVPTLVGALSRWVKRKAVFYRAGKNTFGLIEMRGAK